MNKKYSVGLVAGVLMFLLIISISFLYQMSYKHELDKAQAREDSAVDAEICYYIMECGGYVTVYEADKQTVYEYTSILVEDLPEQVQKQIRKGVKVTNLGQIYGFLENYSS